MGWNGSGGAGSAEGKPNAAKPAERRGGLSPALKGIVAGAVVIVGALVAFFVISGGEKKPAKAEKEKKPAAIAEVKPAAAPKAVEEAQPEKKEKPRQVSLRDPKLTPKQREELREQRLREQSIPAASTNRLFRTGLEQVMSWIFTCELGDDPPPLPQISDFDYVHLEEILNIQNIPGEADSEKAAAAKNAVDYMKGELRKYLEKGGDPQEFLQFFHDELRQAAMERRNAQQMVMEIATTEPELLHDFIEKTNKSLAEKGIKGVRVPVRTLRRLGITDPDLLNPPANANGLNKKGESK